MDSKENNNTSEVEMEIKEEAAEATVTETAAAANGDAEGNQDTNEEEGKDLVIKEGDAAKDNENEASQPSFDGDCPGKIFVGGLPKDTTHEAFNKHFQKYGKIVDSVIMKHRGSGLPRGFGFITYEDPTVVDAVIVDKHVFKGKEVEIKRTLPRGAITGKDFKTKKIFVGGIPTTVDEDEFKNFFAKFGELEEHQIMRDHSSGRSRGFGFISFSTEKAVDDLLIKGNKIQFAGTQVEIKKAEPKKPGSTFGPPPTKLYNNPRPAHGKGFNDNYGAAPGGIESGPYRYGGGSTLGSRARGYGGYGGSEVVGSYGGYGSTSIGAYQGDPSLGFTSRYGGGLGRGYGPSGYDAPTESFDRYGGYGSATGYSGGGGGYGGGVAGAGAGAGSGYAYAYAYARGAGGYGVGSLYGGRREYGGGPSGRFHPYSG